MNECNDNRRKRNVLFPEHVPNRRVSRSLFEFEKFYKKSLTEKSSTQDSPLGQIFRGKEIRIYLKSDAWEAKNGFDFTWRKINTKPTAEPEEEAFKVTTTGTFHKAVPISLTRALKMEQLCEMSLYYFYFARNNYGTNARIIYDPSSNILDKSLFYSNLLPCVFCNPKK